MAVNQEYQLSFFFSVKLKEGHFLFFLLSERKDTEKMALVTILIKMMTSSNINYYKIQGLSRGFDCKEEFYSISCYERLLHDFFSYNKLRNTFGQLPKVALRRLRM